MALESLLGVREYIYISKITSPYTAKKQGYKQNTKRKDFTQEELLEIAEHRYQEARVRGEENKFAGSTLSSNDEKVNATKEAADVIGVSQGTYQRMRYIASHKDDLTSSPDLITYKGQEYSPAEFYEMWNKGWIQTRPLDQMVKGLMQQNTYFTKGECYVKDYSNRRAVRSW